MASSSNGLPNLVSIPQGYQPLNSYGLELMNLAAWHLQRIGYSGILAALPESGSLQPLGTPPNPAATQRRVWLDEPPGSVPFDEQATLALPVPGTGAGGLASPITPVLTFNVPQGFDGVIKWISNNIIGNTAPFVPGSLVWSILINNRPVRNFQNITVEKGTVFQGRQVSPIRLFSGDIVSYTVTQPAIGPTGSTVTSATGYYFPSKGVS